MNQAPCIKQLRCGLACAAVAAASKRRDEATRQTRLEQRWVTAAMSARAAASRLERAQKATPRCKGCACDAGAALAGRDGQQVPGSEGLKIRVELSSQRPPAEARRSWPQCGARSARRTRGAAARAREQSASRRHPCVVRVMPPQLLLAKACHVRCRDLDRALRVSSALRTLTRCLRADHADQWRVSRRTRVWS